MAKFCRIPSKQTAFNIDLIERILVTGDGKGYIYLPSNETIVAPGQFKDEDALLEIVQGLMEHPGFKVDWRVVADAVLKKNNQS